MCFRCTKTSHLCSVCRQNFGNLELENLLLSVAKILEKTIDLTLRVVGRLGARNGLHHRRRAADHDEVVVGGRRHVLLDGLLGDVASRASPSLGRLLEDVVDLQVLVLLCALVNLLAQQNVLLGDISEDERDLSVILRVSEHSVDDLKHGGETSAAGDETELLLRVGRIRVLGNGTLHGNYVSFLQVVDVRRQLAVIVLLDDELCRTSSVSVERRVGAND